MCDVCTQGWRVEATELSTGVVKAVLHPVSADWEEQYSRPGTGSLTASIFGPSASDVWPHTTGVYISRVFPDGSRYGHFGGYIETFGPNPENWALFNLGLQPMDEYPFHRLLADDDEGLSYSTPGYVSDEDPGPGMSQTQIALDLLNLAVSGKGYIPLSGTADPSNVLQIANWNPWDFKNLGEAIQELVEAPNGVTYRMTHHFFENPQRWETRLVFSDELNIDRGIPLRGDLEGWQYGLEVDGKDQASRVYGVGTGESTQQMFSIAYDEDASLPEFQKTIAWKDVSVPATLDAYTVGAVTLYRDPTATPSMTLVGLDDVPPETLITGDIVSPEMGYGLATFRGEKARVVSQAWKLSEGQPPTRTLALLPIIRPSLSVKIQVPAVAPEELLTPEEEVSPPPETPITPPAPQYPAQVFDLTNWKLTLPIGSKGDPDEIKQPALATYSHSDFFHTVEGPGVLFKAPQDGVTTPNSKNTRSELREMRNGGKDNASWSSGTMEAVLAFTHLPSSKPHVVGMQIHDSEDDVSVLRLEGSDLWTTDGDDPHGTKIMSGYQLGTKIKVKVVADGGSIRWYLNDNEVASLGKKVSGGYFKAGAYQQAGTSGSDYGEVIIYSLTVTH